MKEGAQGPRRHARARRRLSVPTILTGTADVAIKVKDGLRQRGHHPGLPDSVPAQRLRLRKNGVWDPTSSAPSYQAGKPLKYI